MKARYLPPGNLPPFSFAALCGPRLPKPSRQLLEGLGFIAPAKSFHSSCCFRNQASRGQVVGASKPRKVTKQPAQATERLPEAHKQLEALLQDTVNGVLHSSTPPREEEILASMGTLENIAQQFRNKKDPVQLKHLVPREESQAAANQLSFLEEGDNMPRDEPATAFTAAMEERSVQRVSDAAHTIITHPNVFITAPVLNAYVNTQSLLNRPETFAEVFSLYANKPVPLEGSNPIQFSPANPNRASSAIPPGVAHTALDAAIQAKILPLCLDIITNSVCTSAHHRSKLVRRALLPASAFAAAPLAAYATATQISGWQETMSSEMARNIAFAGILSYMAFTSTIGYVALTTANDQMDRVTWAQGVPLHQRWLREQERAMLDKVASAWGFRESWRKGEEQGAEWEALKELIGLRGMVLDKVELMEGME